jgi:AcrR family transcriptional regulator
MSTAHSSARQRLLDVAAQLFYQEGIRAVGVDTIVEKSGVGKATLYRHFPSKDDLITAYIEEEDRLHQEWFEEIISPYEGSPKAQLLAWFDACTERIMEPGFRGCPFLNALTEISETDHPARRSSVEHERILRQLFYKLSQQAGARDPEELADQLLLVLNGTLTTALIFGSAGPVVQLKKIVTHLIDLQFENV